MPTKLMTVVFPRLLAGFAVAWALRMAHIAAASDDVARTVALAGVALLHLLAASQLVRPHAVRRWSFVVVAALVAEMVLRSTLMPYGLAVLFWMALITAVSDGRPAERALLLRVCVSTIYAFAAMSKMNASWLAGDYLDNLASRGPLLDRDGSLAPAFDLLAMPEVALLVLVGEAWLAVGLWFRPTRRATAIAGLLLHVSILLFITATYRGLWNLTVMNLGLVAMYTAFWHPLREAAPSAEATPLGTPASERDHSPA